MPEQERELTVRDIGRMGGEATRRKYGADYFRELVKKRNWKINEEHKDVFLRGQGAGFLSKLSKKEHEVLLARNLGNYRSFEEIGRSMGITRAAVHQTEKRGIRKLEHLLEQG